jgi:hypothetical protein
MPPELRNMPQKVDAWDLWTKVTQSGTWQDTFHDTALMNDINDGISYNTGYVPDVDVPHRPSTDLDNRVLNLVRIFRRIQMGRARFLTDSDYDPTNFRPDPDTLGPAGRDEPLEDATLHAELSTLDRYLTSSQFGIPPDFVKDLRQYFAPRMTSTKSQPLTYGAADLRRAIARSIPAPGEFANDIPVALIARYVMGMEPKEGTMAIIRNNPDEAAQNKELWNDTPGDAVPLNSIRSYIWRGISDRFQQLKPGLDPTQRKAWKRAVEEWNPTRDNNNGETDNLSDDEGSVPNPEGERTGVTPDVRDILGQFFDPRSPNQSPQWSPPTHRQQQQSGLHPTTEPVPEIPIDDFETNSPRVSGASFSAGSGSVMPITPDSVDPGGSPPVPPNITAGPTLDLPPFNRPYIPGPESVSTSSPLQSTPAGTNTVVHEPPPLPPPVLHSPPPTLGVDHGYIATQSPLPSPDVRGDRDDMSPDEDVYIPSPDVVEVQQQQPQAKPPPPPPRKKVIQKRKLPFRDPPVKTTRLNNDDDDNELQQQIDAAFVALEQSRALRENNPAARNMTLPQVDQLFRAQAQPTETTDAAAAADPPPPTKRPVGRPRDSQEVRERKKLEKEVERDLAHFRFRPGVPVLKALTKAQQARLKRLEERRAILEKSPNPEVFPTHFSPWSPGWQDPSPTVTTSPQHAQPQPQPPLASSQGNVASSSNALSLLPQPRGFVQADASIVNTVAATVGLEPETPSPSPVMDTPTPINTTQARNPVQPEPAQPMRPEHGLKRKRDERVTDTDSDTRKAKLANIDVARDVPRPMNEDMPPPSARVPPPHRGPSRPPGNPPRVTAGGGGGNPYTPFGGGGGGGGPPSGPDNNGWDMVRDDNFPRRDPRYRRAPVAPRDPGELHQFLTTFSPGSLSRGIFNPGRARMQNQANQILRAHQDAGTRRNPAGFRQPR